MQAEKNDVNIERLFVWSKEVVIKGTDDKELKLYIRLLGDADLNRARVLALRNSAELRRDLKNLDSDERLAYIPFEEELTEDVLRSSIQILTMRELTQQVIKETFVKLPKEPKSDADTEDLEKYQKEVDEYPQKKEDAIKKRLDALIEVRQKELEAQTKEFLYNTYVNVLIKELCDQELMKKFKEYCIFFGTYSDKKMTRRSFTDFAEFDNLPTEIKTGLMDEYTLLELGSEELKK